MAEKLAPEKRHNLFHNGSIRFVESLRQIVLEYIYMGVHSFFKRWVNHLFRSEGFRVGSNAGRGNNIYITLPPNVPTKLFFCKIQSDMSKLHDLCSPIKADSSFWTTEDDPMHSLL
ncbi:unnamed protein product [Ilex paraguariensis]|uniref:Uncharacterized protein n=1 Tax=Ilex paraguariensis TaxID=185542 RepID=A0ABC8QTP0_9AQUA